MTAAHTSLKAWNVVSLPPQKGVIEGGQETKRRLVFCQFKHQPDGLPSGCEQFYLGKFQVWDFCQGGWVTWTDVRDNALAVHLHVERFNGEFGTALKIIPRHRLLLLDETTIANPWDLLRDYRTPFLCDGVIGYGRPNEPLDEVLSATKEWITIELPTQGHAGSINHAIVCNTLRPEDITFYIGKNGSPATHEALFALMDLQRELAEGYCCGARGGQLKIRAVLNPANLIAVPFPPRTACYHMDRRSYLPEGDALLGEDAIPDTSPKLIVPRPIWIRNFKRVEGPGISFLGEQMYSGGVLDTDCRANYDPLERFRVVVEFTEHDLQCLRDQRLSIRSEEVNL